MSRGDGTDETALSSVIKGADVVVGALAPRGALAGPFREVYRTMALATEPPATWDLRSSPCARVARPARVATCR
jgi:hypothetical protein